MVAKPKKKSSSTGRKSAAKSPAPTVKDIPGAVAPNQATTRGDVEPARRPASGSDSGGGNADRRQQLLALLQDSGAGRGDDKGRILRQLLRSRGQGGKGPGGAGAGGGGGKGSQVLDQIISRLNAASGGDDKRRNALVKALERVKNNHAGLEREVESLRARLDEAEEKLRILTEGDDLAGGG